MSEIVERGLLWPNACLFCGSLGPLIDSGVELNGAFQPDPSQPLTGGGYGRAYTCKVCDRQRAKLWGFSPGKKLDELQNASETLEARDKDIRNLSKQVESLTESVADRDRRLRQQQIVIDQYEKRAETYDHLAGILTTNAEALKAVS